MQGLWRLTTYEYAKERIKTCVGPLGMRGYIRSESIVQPPGYRRYVRVVTIQRLAAKINSEPK